MKPLTRLVTPLVVGTMIFTARAAAADGPPEERAVAPEKQERVEAEQREQEHERPAPTVKPFSMSSSIRPPAEDDDHAGGFHARGTDSQGIVDNCKGRYLREWHDEACVPPCLLWPRPPFPREPCQLGPLSPLCCLPVRLPVLPCRPLTRLPCQDRWGGPVDTTHNETKEMIP